VVVSGLVVVTISNNNDEKIRFELEVEWETWLSKADGRSRWLAGGRTWTEQPRESEHAQYRQSWLGTLAAGVQPSGR
jgi:hypothetical protein